MNEPTRVLIALGAAVAGGIAIGATDSDALLRTANFVAPVGTLWVNAIRMTVIPLVVSLIITGVASATDVAAVGRLGGRTLLVFVLLLVGTAIVVMPFAPSLFALLPNDALRPPLPAGAAEAAGEVVAGSQSLTLAQWLTSLIPSNPIAAAATGQIVPLIIFTLLLALAIARSPVAARATLVAFFQALG
ncbi:MAG: cation:dicarboxylate symporter family transporter, partial [Gemmatimonadaceae bacterium]